MKVIVTKLPDKAEDCIFSEYIAMTSKYKCMLQSGMYSRCNLDCGKECPYLKRETKAPSSSKQKQLEEIRDILLNAKEDAILCEDLAPEVVFYGEMAFLTKSYHSRIIVDFNKLALAIYNAGYRKEDSHHAEN